MTWRGWRRSRREAKACASDPAGESRSEMHLTRVDSSPQRRSWRRLRTSSPLSDIRAPRVQVALALLLAIGMSLMPLSAAAAAPVTIVDDNGPDDQPNQKDLSFLTVDYGLPGATTINVQWGWDDTATSGANTRDGCALFDSDRDGNANFALLLLRQLGRQLHHADACSAGTTAPRAAAAAPP